MATTIDRFPNPHGLLAASMSSRATAKANKELLAAAKDKKLGPNNKYKCKIEFSSHKNFLEFFPNYGNKEMQRQYIVVQVNQCLSWPASSTHVHTCRKSDLSLA